MRAPYASTSSPASRTRKCDQVSAPSIGSSVWSRSNRASFIWARILRFAARMARLAGNEPFACEPEGQRAFARQCPGIECIERRHQRAHIAWQMLEQKRNHVGVEPHAA